MRREELPLVGEIQERILEIADLSEFNCYMNNLPPKQKKSQEHAVLGAEHSDNGREVCYRMEQDIKFKNVMVFAHEYEGRTAYSLGVSSRKFADGHKTDEWVNGYITAQFPRDSAPSNKEKIDISKSFFAAYETRDGKSGIKLVVQEWNTHFDEDSFGV